MKDSLGRSDESLPARRSSGPLNPPHSDPYDDYGHEPHPGGAGKRLSLRLLARAFRRYWWQALLVWLAGSAGLVSLVAQKVQPTFDAISQVKVELDSTLIFGGAGGPHIDFSQFMQTQVSLITSPTILGSADPVENARRHPVGRLPIERAVERAILGRLFASEHRTDAVAFGHKRRVGAESRLEERGLGRR